MQFSRRDLLKILGVSAVGTQLPWNVLAAPAAVSALALASLPVDTQDRLLTAEGLSWQLLLKEGDALSPKLNFGTCNDYLQFFPLTGPNHGILWVNHEYLLENLHSTPERTRETVDREMDMVGGSLVEIRQTKKGWEQVYNSSYNRRVTGRSVIPFAAGRSVRGKREAIGTLANCAGGRTPWGTLLTCEENYDNCYGERDRKTGKVIPSQYQKWETVYPERPPEHYGWVVEVNPLTGEAKKHLTLGRFAHECATVRLGPDGRVVVYSGDDANDEHLYKFIASEKGSLEEGTLYVANTQQGAWLPLLHSDPRLKSVFKDQIEVWTYCREAAKLLGATPLDRPEDIEIDPFSGDVLVACTNNKPAQRPFGSIMKLKEDGNDPRALKFTTETFLAGGENAGFACPDNMAFDKAGNLWFTTDISGWDMHKGAVKNFGNNGLFVVLREGPQAGVAIKLASAPRDAEFTGPLFSPDHKSLFLSVQHPGELTTDLKNPTSTWPLGQKPQSSVVVLSGPLLERITGA